MQGYSGIIKMTVISAKRYYRNKFAQKTFLLVATFIRERMTSS